MSDKVDPKEALYEVDEGYALRSASVSALVEEHCGIEYILLDCQLFVHDVILRNEAHAAAELAQGRHRSVVDVDVAFELCVMRLTSQ